MIKSAPRLVLLSPLVAGADAFASTLGAALDSAAVASVLLRLEPADERALVNRVKSVAAVTQPRDCALVVATDGGDIDLGLIAARGGADGVHAARPGDIRALRERVGADRIVGAGCLTSRHDAMAAGEGGADYVLFGEPDADGSAPLIGDTLDRAAWWAEIFETPCVAVASQIGDCAALTETGAEFIALAPDAWIRDPAASVRQALAALTRVGRRVA